jgi:hypothetical protein
MYSYGVWGLSLQQAVGLTSLQTNILAGLIFSGGSFLTDTIIRHCAISLKWAGLTPGIVGAVAYSILGLIPIEELNFGVLLVLIGMVGYSVMGLFICAIQAVNYLNKLTGFNTNVGTAIAQTSYGLGCMFWVTILHEVCDDSWRNYCVAVAFPLVGVGLLCFFIYPHSRDVPGNTPDEIPIETEVPQAPSPAPLKTSDWRSSAVLVVILVLYTSWYGTSICLQTNSAAIMQSVGKEAAAVQMTVLFGVFQTIGRVSSLAFAIWAKSGSGDENSGEKDSKYRQRILWQPVVGVSLLLVMHLVLVLEDSPPYAMRQAITSLAGIPYGLSWTSLFHVIDALFDSHDSIVTLGMVFGPGLGPIVFDAVIGVLYDQQVAVVGPDSGTCDGSHCFMPAFKVLLACDCVALLLVIILYRLVAAGDGLLPLPVPRFLMKSSDREEEQEGQKQDSEVQAQELKPNPVSSATDMYGSGDSMRRAFPSSLELKRNNSSFIIPT